MLDPKLNNTIYERLLMTRQKIRDAEIANHRPQGSVKLVAVSKFQHSQQIEAAIQAGQQSFAENYLQEALLKIDQFKNSNLEWHFIGSIQSNKTKLIASRFSWVHTVTRSEIAERLNDQRPEALPKLNICIQVFIENETHGTGVAIEKLQDFANSISALNRLQLRGLMVILKPDLSPAQQLNSYKKVAALQQQLICSGLTLDTLSMGMSNDYEIAIAAGSTLVRIGTAIFGERKKT